MNSKNHEDNGDFIRKRITELREQKGVTEHQMSKAMGRSPGYIHNITVGRALPSMSEFFIICEYLGVTVRDFFCTEKKNPALINELLNKAQTLNAEGIKAVLGVINMLKDDMLKDGEET
jgi:transcriptional regulator with XRE-family HTH domain